MLILVGESASGKSTIEKYLVDHYDYKKIVCEYAGIDEAETELQLISREYVKRCYDYKTI